jgi:RNA ligase (TIGR02306 family)
MPNGDEGFRLKSIKLRGQLSQGLLTKIPEGIFNPKEGDDLTEALDIIKYEPPIPAQLAGVVKGLFPSFIPKTDEIRVQNFESDTGLNICGSTVYITEKLDGTSFTCYFNNGEFGVCSRNLELKETEGNTHWLVTNKLKLREKLSALGRNIALQGELVGPGVQKNMYRFNDQRVYFFTAYDIDTRHRFSFEELKDLLSSLELEMVPVLEDKFVLPSENLVEKMLAYADNKSFFNSNVDREGVVIRGLDKQFSFKAISNIFLLKND